MRKTTSHETAKARKRALIPRALASGIPVWCSCDRILDAEGLKPHPDNSHRSHPPAQLDRYELVIAGKGGKPGNGWRKAITVSNLSGCIVKGHGAWLMARRRGWQVPVELQDYASRAEERRDLLADNRLAEEAVTDDAKLAKLLADMDAGDVILAGYTAEEMQALLEESAEVAAGEFPITAKLGEEYDFVMIFTRNATDFARLQELLGIIQEQSYKKTGVGLGRAIPLARALAALRKNRDSLDVACSDDDDPPARPGRGDRGAKKPAARVSKATRRRATADRE